jgi:hypothetical protein
MTSDATSTIASTDLKPAPMDVRRAPLRATVARAIFVCRSG